MRFEQVVEGNGGFEAFSDADLLAAIADGDGAAFSALYDRHARILYAVVVRIVGERSDADDVLQEVFVQVSRDAKAFDPSRGGAFSWLALLARSRALDRLRSLGARERLATEAAKEPRPETEDLAETASRLELGHLARAALAEIPETQRQTLELAYFHGLTQTEIAARLGKPLGTVKTSVRLGLTRLRAVLNGRHDQSRRGRLGRSGRLGKIG